MRELDIINDLMRHHDYLSIEYFMEKYSVSKRTLQSDLSYLVKIESVRGFHLIQKRGRGYLLEITSQDKFDQFISELDKQSNHPKISVENIIGYIALIDDYIAIDTLANTLESSRSLINNYKDEMDGYLLKYDLKMKRKAHFGIKIANPLIEHRSLLIDLYLKHNEIIKKEIKQALKKQFLEIQNSLIDLLKSENLNINYIELNEVLAWLKVTIYLHIKLKTPIKQSSGCKLLKLIANLYEIGISDEDISKFKQLVVRKSRKVVTTSDGNDQLISNITNFLKVIDQQNNTTFNEDEDFKQLLIIHVNALIDRMHFKISYQNPIIDELEIKYPMIFNIAISLSLMLYEVYGVKPSRDEIGFIATHFAVHSEKESTYKLKKYNRIAIVCSTGGGSAYLIKLKINNLFENAIIETFSLLQMDEVRAFKPDVIFSISELDIDLRVPLIYIKELLDDYDILKIKQLVMFDKVDKVSINESRVYLLNQLFDSNYFTIDHDSNDYLECLIAMAKKFEDKGIGGDNYTNLVLTREEFSTTIYLNSVAIPHPIEMRGNKDLIAVKILKKPIIYQNRKVQVIFMVSLKKDNLEFNKVITSDLFDIMNDSSKVQEILKVKSFKEFMALMNKKVSG